MKLIAYFKAHPLWLGLLLMAAYFLYFVTPEAFGPNSFGRGQGPETAADMNERLFSELGLVASILIVVAVFGWWKSCGFTLKFNKGGLKFVLLPLGFTLLILGYAAILAQSDGQTIVRIIGPRPLATLILVSLLVGVFEETLFRGIVYMGWEQRFGPILALLVSSVIFGSFHMVNWVTGQPLGETLWQSVHAFYIGVMYAALRLRIGSIFPVIILHGFWDATIMIMGSANASLVEHATKTLSDIPAAQAGDGTTVVSFLFSSIEPLYGLFVLWRWNVWRKRRNEE